MGTTASGLGTKPRASGLLTDQLESCRKGFRGNNSVRAQHVWGEQWSWRGREGDIRTLGTQRLAGTPFCAMGHAHTTSGH